MSDQSAAKPAAIAPTHAHVRTAVARPNEPARHPQSPSAISLAAAQSESNDEIPEDELGSLYDIDVPIPGVPAQKKATQSSRRQMQPIRQSSPESNSQQASASDRTTPDMRIRIEPVPVPVNGNAERLAIPSGPVVSAAELPNFETGPATQVTAGAFGGTSHQDVLPAGSETPESTTAGSEARVASNGPMSLQLTTPAPAAEPEVNLEAAPAESLAAQQNARPIVEQTTMAEKSSPVASSMSDYRPSPPRPAFLTGDDDVTPKQTIEEPTELVFTTPKKVTVETSTPATQSATLTAPPAHIAMPAAQQLPPQPAETPQASDYSDSEMVMLSGIVVAPQDSASVTTGSPVLEYSVEHPTICKMIRTSENVVSLIGLREGQTRIAVVTASATGERQIEIRDVRVASESSPQVSLNNLAREMKQTVAKLYPQSRVEIKTNDDKLIVMGNVPTESDARKIISLVRKMTLSPVVDQLKSYSRR